MLDLVKALADSNALAIIVAAAAAFMTGAAWYSPALFSRQWIKELGWSKKDMDKTRAEGNIGRSMVYCFISTVLLSLAISMLINLLYVSSFWNGIVLGLFVGIGITVTSMFIHHVFEQRSWKLFAINAGYTVATCSIIAGILGVWPK